VVEGQLVVAPGELSVALFFEKQTNKPENLQPWSQVSFAPSDPPNAWRSESAEMEVLIALASICPPDPSEICETRLSELAKNSSALVMPVPMQEPCFGHSCVARK
jgi:hypothetical protein